MGNPPVVVALLLVRVVVGVTMVRHGYNHWRGGGKIAGTGRWFAGLGLRHGELQAGVALGVAVLATAGLLATFYRPAPTAAPAPAAPAPASAPAAPASDGGLVP